VPPGEGLAGVGRLFGRPHPHSTRPPAGRRGSGCRDGRLAV